MKVFKIVPRGYCKGVVNAIKIAKESKQKYPNDPIYILGMIVHNQYIVDALDKLGIKTIDQKGLTRLELLDLIDHGIVIITAHGAGENVFEKAKQKGLKVIDATCKDVIKTHDLIRKAIAQGEEVLYIGKKGHPEAEGALAIDHQHIHLIQTIQDIQPFINKNQKYMVTNQTTMSMWDVQSLCHYAQQYLKNVRILEETCHATSIRQQAMSSLPKEISVIYVVGDPHSNNTTRLANIAKEHSNARVYLIETIEDICINDLKENDYIGITAGASTPTYLTNQIIDYLEQLDLNNQSTYIKPKVDLTKII